MRIIYFSRDYTPHDHRFLAAMVGKGIEVHYLRLERRGHQQEDRMLPPGVIPVSWAGGLEAYDPRKHRALLADLRKQVRRIKPDLIHAGPVQTAAWLAAQAGFHPLVSMSWGSDLLVEAESSSQMRRLTEFTLANTDVLIGDCQAVKEKAVEFGFPAERVVTFPWGVDLKKFSPGEKHNEIRVRAGWQEAFVVLHLRSWEPVYGVEVFAKAFRKAAEECPELRLLMPGNGSLAPRIRQILMPVNDRVHFLGQVSHEKLPTYYRAADLYVSASYSDGSSVSLMEALACGLPALVSDIPGNREWIAESEAGWLFPDGDEDVLAQGLITAVENRNSLGENAAAARKLAEARADWPQNVKKLMQAYQLALEIGGRR
ncbi:MAG: glycosyltransferase [Anaerolineales bacterium]|nr:glycosyltransferase [Anaerolineales bacterium]